MVKMMNRYALASVVLTALLALAGCGTSNASVNRNRMTGVSDSGYPPKAQGVDYGSPAIGSAGPPPGVKEKKKE
jgi:hypothetical protein